MCPDKWPAGKVSANYFNYALACQSLTGFCAAFQYLDQGGVISIHVGGGGVNKGMPYRAGNLLCMLYKGGADSLDGNLMSVFMSKPSQNHLATLFISKHWKSVFGTKHGLKWK